MITVTRLDIADANVLITGAVAHAGIIGVPMCIAITDEAGQLIAFLQNGRWQSHLDDDRHRQSVYRCRCEKSDPRIWRGQPTWRPNVWHFVRH